MIANASLNKTVIKSSRTALPQHPLRPVSSQSVNQFAKTAPSTPKVTISTAMSPNTVFNGRYTILKVLAETGMSQVYRALDNEQGKTTVIKCAVDQALPLEALSREAQHLKEIEHPAFPKFYEYAGGDSKQYIAMEEIKALELGALIHREEPISLPQAIDISMQVLYGLEALHQKGLIHRDLKPGNIMVEPEGRVRLLDLGLCCKIGHKDKEDHLIGTPAYMAPEQVATKKLSPAVDLYALGLIFYEMLTRENPMRSGNQVDILNQQLLQPMPKLQEEELTKRLKPSERDGLNLIISKVHKQLREIIEKMTAKEDKERFQSVREPLEQLKKISEKLSRYGIFAR